MGFVWYKVQTFKNLWDKLSICHVVNCQQIVWKLLLIRFIESKFIDISRTTLESYLLFFFNFLNTSENSMLSSRHFSDENNIVSRYLSAENKVSQQIHSATVPACWEASGAL